MKHSTTHIKLVEHGYLAVSAAGTITTFKELASTMNSTNGQNNRESRAYSLHKARKFLDTLNNPVTCKRGKTYIYAKVVFLFEDEFLSETFIVMTTQYSAHVVFSLHKSRVAAKHRHEAIYNTLFHNFEVREDGSLMIVARQKSPTPFAVWITEEPIIIPENIL